MPTALEFTHVSHPQRVVFSPQGAGRAIQEEVERLRARRPMVIAGSHAQVDGLSDLDVALWWSDVRPHVPIKKAEAARRAAEETGVDVLISIGGGSAVGLAKAVALTTRLPVIAVPTTYAGSEATPVWGITEDARKTTGVDVGVLPVAVIYDAALTLSMPVSLSVVSGLNALAHCVDSLWAPGANPINALWAVEGMRALARGLRAVKEAPLDMEARHLCLYGTYLAGLAFGAAGSGLHHKICHVLGGTFDLPHAETHAIVLPHVLAYQSTSFPSAARQVAQAVDADAVSSPGDGVAALQILTADLESPVALRDYGLRESDVPLAAKLSAAAVNALPDPRPDLEELQDIIRGAWTGAMSTT